MHGRKPSGRIVNMYSKDFLNYCVLFLTDHGRTDILIIYKAHHKYLRVVYVFFSRYGQCFKEPGESAYIDLLFLAHFFMSFVIYVDLHEHLLLTIGVAPITQYTHLRYKNCDTQGSAPNVVKVISHTTRNCS